MAKILLLEPYYGGSHKLWADGLASHSSHSFTVEGLQARFWKWRMHGAAITLYNNCQKDLSSFDLIIVTDMMDVALFRSLAAPCPPILMYFHENQLAYPWSKGDKDVNKGWDKRYMWINFTSALAADWIWFNSKYNYQSFFENLPLLLRQFPDHNQFEVEKIKSKSDVMTIGLDLQPLYQKKKIKKELSMPVIVWNHRWEYDKNPNLFFESLFTLYVKGCEFFLLILGKKYSRYPSIFNAISEKLPNERYEILPNLTREEYINKLRSADIIPVTNDQDFFGISTIEGLAAGLTPFLPANLVYDEHVDPINHSELFYNDEQDFVHKLELLLTTYDQYDFSDHIMKYDWSSCIKSYDNALKNLV